MTDEWNDVNVELPPDDPKPYESTWVDVWISDHREPDVTFKKGNFERMVLDYQGDFSHYENISGVTHWMYPSEPTLIPE